MKSRISQLGIPMRLLIVLFIAISSAGVALQLKPASVVQASTTTWTAYNDCNLVTGDPTTNITTYNCATNNAGGLLKKYGDGTNTSVTVKVTNPEPNEIKANSAGAYTASGTDAYTTFYGIASMVGSIQFKDSDDYITLTFTGLDPTRTYTFATSANDPTNTSSGNSKFVISDVTSATNASTTGATVSTSVFTGDTTTFNTKTNTTPGYVARWTNINPGADCDFTVKISQASSTSSDGPSVFMLQETAYPVIKSNGTLKPFTATTGYPSDSQHFTCSGTGLVDNITVTAPAPYEVSLKSNSDFSPSLTLTPTSGTVPVTTIYVRLNSDTAGDFSGNIACTSTGATEMDIAATGTVNDPTITITGTLADFASIPGGYSKEQTYTVAATYLVEDLIITAPTDFEISLTSGAGFGPSIDLTPVDGVVTTTTIYVRFYRVDAGTSTGNITHVSTGLTEDQPVVGNSLYKLYFPPILAQEI